ncbi:MAG TPA: response regulator [Dehalococcoidia bacterium]|nr:response regulator [Dehalococcoidia bacterium]
MAHVLIVDDEPTIRRLVQTVLELEGHKVTTADDGQQALDRVGEQPPDVLVLDVRLPGIDGWEVLRRLDALQLGTRVVLLSAAPDIDLAAGDGATAVLAKPFEIDHLVAAVDRLTAPAH